ncbi:AraC family transcriptional regulator [Chelativorans sp. AA-79]|uniref:AraC family transcriptional regulator n=1 Tax=Chelativorans sp. AA-79 TaxID=3028735 RepID=UPI0023F94E7A|nr:AraC family transcriptional regulator [Chelativorans sp. AA-79]WEX09297.1 AraC family transcriptional regulator [Chelativorans sp. AA-79]
MIYAQIAMSLSQSAEITPDPFSKVLAALGARSVRGTGLEAAGDWALAFDGRARLKFVAVTCGRCWLLLPDHPPEVLEEGDVVLISNTRYVVASNPAVEPIDGMPLYAPPGHDLVRLGAGDETAIMGGGSGFADGSAAFVLDALPRFLRVDRTSSTAEAVARTLKSLRAEVSSADVGGVLVAERLAEILVIEAVRAFVATSSKNSVGWITALADPRIGKALKLLHGDVARRWTVPMLASEVGMSRSAFTQHFTDRVGRPPLDYLTRWRMVLAQRKLNEGQTVAEAATAVGYNSQSAFSHAFKRTFGRTPRSAG